MTSVHSYPAAVVERLAADLAQVAAGQLVAVYLHGSAVLGGWQPGRSDIDVLIVVADDVGDATIDSMARTIADVQAQDPPEECDAPMLEASVVTAAAARDPGSPWPFLRHVVIDPGGATRVVDAGGDRDLLMHYAACRAAGHSAFGPAPRVIIGPIAGADIVPYLADELEWGLANAPERYAVLNACRARQYVTDGKLVSKIAGGETALRRGTGPAEVISRALAQQRGTQPDQRPAADAVAFVEAVAAILRETAREWRVRPAAAWPDGT